MKKYYHFTSYENLESINEYGLIPQSGGRTRSIGDNRCAVFLSKGIQNTILMYGSILWHYNRHSGDLGFKSIKFREEQLEQYNELLERFPLDEEYNMEFEAIKSQLNGLNKLCHIKIFMNIWMMEYI